MALGRPFLERSLRSPDAGLHATMAVIALFPIVDKIRSSPLHSEFDVIL